MHLKVRVVAGFGAGLVAGWFLAGEFFARKYDALTIRLESEFDEKQAELHAKYMVDDMGVIKGLIEKPQREFKEPNPHFDHTDETRDYIPEDEDIEGAIEAAAAMRHYQGLSEGVQPELDLVPPPEIPKPVNYNVRPLKGRTTSTRTHLRPYPISDMAYAQGVDGDEAWNESESLLFYAHDGVVIGRNSITPLDPDRIAKTIGNPREIVFDDGGTAYMRCEQYKIDFDITRVDDRYGS